MSSLSTFSSSSSSSSSHLSRPWESLPNDVLVLLLGFQESFFDQLRFGAVCRSWRVAATMFRETPRRLSAVPTLPILTWIDPREGGEAAESCITRCFYSLPDDRVYRLKVPSESYDWHCWGSSHGWLAMLDLRARPFLFNPISGARVDLPPLSTLTRMEMREEDGATMYVYHNPFRKGELSPHTGKMLQDHFVWKLVLSSSPLDPKCIAMALVCEYKLLVYSRPGDDSWHEVPTQLWVFQDIIYHDHKFYALAYTGETITIDFKDPGSPMVEEFAPKHSPLCSCQTSMYLVALPSGEILQVVKYVESDPYRYKTETFEVYMLELSSEGKEWVLVDWVDDYCLFLGFNHSFSLPPSKVLGKYRANCIYFTDDCVERYFRKDYGGLDFGIFDIYEGTFEQFCHIDAQRVMPPPMWITSSI